MKRIDQVPASGFGDLLLKSIAICAVVFTVVYFTILEGHAQTSIEVSPPWSGSYITNTWQVSVTPGSPGIAAVPNRYLLMNGQNQVTGELTSKVDAAGALYGAELKQEIDEYITLTGSATTNMAALGPLRQRMLATQAKWAAAVK